jgi:hypothetical protein
LYAYTPSLAPAVALRPQDSSSGSTTSTGQSSSKRTRDSDIHTDIASSDYIQEVSVMLGAWEDCESLVKEYFVSGLTLMLERYIQYELQTIHVLSLVGACIHIPTLCDIVRRVCFYKRRAFYGVKVLRDEAALAAASVSTMQL